MVAEDIVVMIVGIPFGLVTIVWIKIIENMKQYTTPEQTDKLIELGFVPKARIKEVQVVHSRIEVAHDCNFTIGELIEMLPRCIESGSGSDEAVLEISYDSQDFVWFCGHRWMYNRGWRLFNGDYRTCDDNELIDALYRYVVALKEEGVIWER